MGDRYEIAVRRVRKRGLGCGSGTREVAGLGADRGAVDFGAGSP
jgi:hypothetical protein